MSVGGTGIHCTCRGRVWGGCQAGFKRGGCRGGCPRHPRVKMKTDIAPKGKQDSDTRSERRKEPYDHVLVEPTLSISKKINVNVTKFTVFS